MTGNTLIAKIKPKLWLGSVKPPNKKLIPSLPKLMILPIKSEAACNALRPAGT